MKHRERPNPIDAAQHPAAAEMNEVGEYGTCPHCVGDVPLVDGLVGPHGEWRFAGKQGRVTDVPCAGSGQAPEVDA